MLRGNIDCEVNSVYRRAWLTVLVLIFWATVLFTQEEALPVAVHVPVLLKVLSFKRSLVPRAGAELIIGIVYQRNFRASLKTKEKLLEMFNGPSVHTIGNTPIRCVSIEVTDGRELAKDGLRDDVDVLYITPMRAISLERVTAASRSKQLLTLTGVPEYVKAGISIGIGSLDNKPIVLVNLAALRAEGAPFNSQLLNIAKVVR